MMPVLVVLSVIIAVYSVSRPGAMAGVKYFLIPNVENFSWMTVVSAMGSDVLFTVNCDGYFDHIWFLHEKECVY